MILQPLNLKKICLRCYTGISRLVVLTVLLITASVCNSSTPGKEDDGEILDPIKNSTLMKSDSVKGTNNASVNTSHAADLPYDLANPDKKYTLPNSLKEVSGLAYYGEGEILCIQDEKANVYTYDLREEEVTSSFDFGKKGDYEDIALAGSTVYVIRSDGRIYEIRDFPSADPDVKDHNTDLSGKNNTEGLVYDPASDALLVACKDSPSTGKENPYKGYRAVYRFTLQDKELEKEPYLLIDLEKLDIHRKISSLRDFSLRIMLRLHLIESKTVFYPSAIAIHPFYDQIYILSSKGKILVILDRKGNVLHIEDLDAKTFRQPEGICFSPEGDMFISNEGKGGKGTILKFGYRGD